MNSWKSSACGSALTSPSSASSQSFYRALFIEPFWRSLWPCAFLWGSTFQTQHSFLPEASWSMTRTLVPVYPVPATCTSPSPHPSPITHTHTHTHTCTHTEVCGLRLQSCQNTGCLDHPCKGDSRTHHIYMSLCICNKAITNLIAISLQRHLLVAKACLRGRTLNIAAGQGHRGWTSFRISPEGSSPWPPWPISSCLLLWAS